MLPARAELLWVTKMLVSTFLPGTAAVSAQVPHYSLANAWQ